MNPKKLATVSALALVTFVFCFISMLFALGGYSIFRLLGDTAVSTCCLYMIVVAGSISLLSLIVAVIVNTILVSLRF